MKGYCRANRARLGRLQPPGVAVCSVVCPQRVSIGTPAAHVVVGTGLLHASFLLRAGATRASMPICNEKGVGVSRRWATHTLATHAPCNSAHTHGGVGAGV